ncbi:MAG: hypothetical protein ACOX2E_02090 [Syntrophaceticus sp.]
MQLIVPRTVEGLASTGSDKIAVINLTGTIAFSQGSSLLEASGTSATMDDLERAEEGPLSAGGGPKDRFSGRERRRIPRTL